MYIKISVNNLLKLLNFKKLKEQWIDLNKNYTLKNSIAVLPRVLPFVIIKKKKKKIHCITADGRKDFRVATMKGQMLLTLELQIDVVMVISKDKDILVSMIWGFSKLNITNKVVSKIRPWQNCKYCKGNGIFRSNNLFSFASTACINWVWHYITYFKSR